MGKLLESIYETFNIDFEINNISNITIDTRKISKGDIFFGINSGNNHIEEALAKGASLAISDDLRWNSYPNVIIVEDSIKALQTLAKNYRNKLKIKLIGVTGSEGKTTTKDIIHGVLSSKYITKKTSGNYNNHIGLPLTLLSFKEEDEFGVVEMGMSNFGEIELLCNIANIDYGVITNIGDSHLEFMINRDNVFKEKSSILKTLVPSKAFIFGDDFYLKNIPGIKIGFDKNNNYILKNTKEGINGVSFLLNNQLYTFKLNGQHNAINASFAIAIGNTLGLTSSEIQKGLDASSISSMRFEKIESCGITYINDAYNASPVSTKASLDTFEEIETLHKKLAILGDMGELGTYEELLHEEVLAHALNTSIDNFIVFGKLMKKSATKFNNKKIIICSTKEEVKELIKEKFYSHLILLKGSNFNRLWEIIE